MENLLKETAFLNFNHPMIQELVKDRNWRNMSDKDKILAIYN